MSDSYQAIYDATRSRMGNGDIGSAIEQALRDANISHYVAMAADSISQNACIAAEAGMAPSVLYRPTIYRDGNQWCALYGDDLQIGVAGFGDSPALAMQDFNKNWGAILPASPEASPPIDQVARHKINEWADMATNGLQWLKNIRDGISTVDAAIASMVANYNHCRDVNDTPVERLPASVEGQDK